MAVLASALRSVVADGDPLTAVFRRTERRTKKSMLDDALTLTFHQRNGFPSVRRELNRWYMKNQLKRSAASDEVPGRPGMIFNE